MEQHAYWLAWVMVLTIIAMAIAIISLYDRVQGEKRRSYEMALQFSEIANKTGFLNVGLVDPRHFVEYLERHGFDDPSKPHEWEYRLYDADLNNLVNTAVDMSKGRANMDVGIAFMQDLDKVLDRLNPQNAPHHYGHPAEKEEG